MDNKPPTHQLIAPTRSDRIYPPRTAGAFPIYTFGYRLMADPAELIPTLESMNGLVVDIRYQPEYGNPLWHGSKLAQVFTPRNYVKCRELGNVNFNNNGPIKLNQPKEGIETILELSKFQPLVLICSCVEFDQCHRKTVSRALYEHGITTRELTFEDIRPAPPKEGFVKALSFYDPWGTLTAHGIKYLETRTWGVPYRGEVAIHISSLKTALKTYTDEDLSEFYNIDFRDELELCGYSDENTYHSLPWGHIIGTAQLTDCFQTTGIDDPRIPTGQKHMGNFDAGRWVWVFSEAKLLDKPIKRKGQRMLWETTLEDDPEEFNNQGEIKTGIKVDFQSITGERVQYSSYPDAAVEENVTPTGKRKKGSERTDQDETPDEQASLF